MIRVLTILILAASVSACAIPYYTQSVMGHLKLMAGREPIEDLLADPDTDPQLRERLSRVKAIREFSVTELGLPDNDSYRVYAAIEREHVVWNVFATEEFSVEPLTWCFPVAGCLAYRGYFREAAAEDFAEDLTEDGYDSHVGGVTAYSTLGNFDDPVLSTMLDYSEPYLAGIIFHELAHQQLYVADDSAFNESYATVVEDAGVARWLDRTDGDGAGETWRRKKAEADQRQDAFNRMLLATRDRLEALYARDLSAAAMRERKAAIFRDLEEEFGRMSEDWLERFGPDADGDGDHGYAAWFDEPLNNARLVPVATYHGFEDGFRRIFEDDCAGDFGCFHARAADLAELPKDERHDVLQDVLEDAAPTAPTPGG